MNFQEFWKENDIWKHDPYISDDMVGIEEKCSEYGWNSCKNEILELLEKNKELEFISHNGKKVYRIYGAVIDKIKKQI